MSWRDITLGEVITLQRGHDLPEQQRRPGTIPVLGSAGINGYHDSAKTGGPGVVIGRSGASFGKAHYTSRAYWPHNTVLYVKDFKDNHPRFVYYLLDSIDFASFNSGSAQPSLNRNYLYGLRIRFPSLPVQAKIAAILSAYDDLIENNLRRIKILEKMAQNLYREWFVKFRFPGHQHARFTDSPLGLIPEGWEVAALGDIVNLCRKSVQPQNFPNELFEHFSFPAFDSGKLPAVEKGQTIRSGKYEVPIDCVLVPKLNPHIPRVWLPRPSNDLRSIASTEYLILEPKKYSTAFYYGLFNNPEMVEKLAGRADGTSTSHKRLKPGDFLAQPTVAPPDSIAEAFDSLATPASDLVISLIRKNTTLRRTRDLLLPRLISGEVDVSELEITIPEEIT
ncbi:MAG: restriction endonuclease subunit S [Coprothermobacterota bacterium]|nr:restriction endonuclease subunit S [Coprothermobacterota bacterium]